MTTLKGASTFPRRPCYKRAMPIAYTLGLTYFNMMSLRAGRVLVTLYALHLGADAPTIGILAGVFAFFPMLLSYHAGKISDRFGARWPMTIAALVGTGGMLLPVAMPAMPAVFAAAALSGLSSVFYNLSVQNMVGIMSTTATRARNYSNYAMTVSVANAAGPMMVGFAIDRSGYGTAFVCTSLLLLVAFVMLLVRGGVLPGGHRGTPAQEAAEAATAGKRQSVWPVITASAMAQGALDVFLVYIPVYAAGQGISASAIGIIIAMTAAGGFFARIILPQLIARVGALRLFGLALALGGVCLALVPFANGALALGIISFVFGCGLNVSQPISLTLMYNRSPKGQSGAGLGLRFAVDNASRLFTPMIFGAATAVMGIGVVFWINAALLGLGGLVAKMEGKD